MNPYREFKVEETRSPVVVWEGEVTTEFGKEKIRIVRLVVPAGEQHVMESCEKRDALGVEVWLRVRLVSTK